MVRPLTQHTLINSPAAVSRLRLWGWIQAGEAVKYPTKDQECCRNEALHEFPQSLEWVHCSRSCYCVLPCVTVCHGPEDPHFDLMFLISLHQTGTGVRCSSDTLKKLRQIQFVLQLGVAACLQTDVVKWYERFIVQRLMNQEPSNKTGSMITVQCLHVWSNPLDRHSFWTQTELNSLHDTVIRIIVSTVTDV